MPVFAAAAATCRVWLDWTPPIETSVSQPWASASATRYSSLRVLLPPYARPLLQSSRLAQISAPPRWAVRRSSRCTGEGPKSSGWRSNASRFIARRRIGFAHGGRLPRVRGDDVRLLRHADRLGDRPARGAAPDRDEPRRGPRRRGAA